MSFPNNASLTLTNASNRARRGSVRPWVRVNTRVACPSWAVDGSAKM